MCGICGIIGPGRNDGTFRMISAMRHRGPDDFGVVLEAEAALGMTRLAVLDLSPAGHQPMWNSEKSICIVYNGEVYNFQELRTELEQKGHVFHSCSDTEIVLRLYEQYGDDFVARLRGMFAFAIYDRRQGINKERLLLARDPFGIKPLYYFTENKRLVFASELKALLASGLVPRVFNRSILPILLVKGSIPQPETAVEGVQQLLPAHRMIFQEGICRVERYWDFSRTRYPQLLQLPYHEQVNFVRKVLEVIVAMQMISDVPIGAFLSGGVDSSLLVAFMARQSAQKVKTFSVGFGAEGADIDETDDAARVARYVGTDHTRVEVHGALVRDKFNHFISALDQPSVDGLNSYLVSWVASQHVKVAISGTGGDELFAGYPWFATMVAAEKQGVDNFALSYANQYTIYGAEQALRTVHPEVIAQFQADHFLSELAYRQDQMPDAQAFERVSVLCLRGYTQNQLLRDIDAVSMSHSLEVRVPFLDTVLADVALALPIESKINPRSFGLDPYAATYRDLGVKRILIDIGRGMLPPDMDVQPKRGFGMPFDYWLKNNLIDILEDTLSPASVHKRGLFSVDAVQATKQSFYSGSVGWSHPWLLMVTELWCRNNLDD